MTSRIFRSIFLVASLVLVAGLTFTMGILYQYFGKQLEKELQNEARYLSISVENLGADSLRFLDAENDRVTLVDAEGRVLFDNKADPSGMENHAEREEIKEALSIGSGSAAIRIPWASVRSTMPSASPTAAYLGSPAPSSPWPPF